MCWTRRSRSWASSSHGATPPSWSSEDTRISSPGSNARPAVRDRVKLSEVMLAPKITSPGSQRRNAAALDSASLTIPATRRLVSYDAPMFALASRRQRAIASPTESGTWLPPGASRKAKSPCSELNRRLTSVTSIVTAVIAPFRSSLARIELLNQRRPRPPQIGQLALRDQLREHGDRCALRPRGVLADASHDGRVVAEAPDPDPLVPVGQRLGELVEVLELAAVLVELDEIEPRRGDARVEGAPGVARRGGDGAKTGRVEAAAVPEGDADCLVLPRRHPLEHLHRRRHVVQRAHRAVDQAQRRRDVVRIDQSRGLLDLVARELQPQLRALVHGREQQLVAVDHLLGLLLQREQLVGAQVALVVAPAGAFEHGLREVVLGGFTHRGVSPLRILARVSRSMFPPDTIATTLPVPRSPRAAAASASAPAPSAITRRRRASVRIAAAVSSRLTASASSISAATRGHISSSTPRLPEPSTNDGT